MPSATNVDKVAEIKQMFADASAIFVADYQGLTVADDTTLRRQLRENNVKYIVAKNTLLKLAAEQAGVSGIEPHLVGPTAVAFTADDAAVAAKILNDSFKDKALPRMKVFVVDGEVHQGADILRLADLPTREVLLAQIVAAVEAPISELIQTIEALFRELIGTLDALADEVKSAASPSEGATAKEAEATEEKPSEEDSTAAPASSGETPSASEPGADK